MEWAISRQMASPSPAPSTPLAAAKGRNSQVRASSLMPGPLSQTTIRAPLSSCSKRMPRRPPSGVWRIALASRLDTSSPAIQGLPRTWTGPGVSSSNTRWRAAISGDISSTASRAISSMRRSCRSAALPASSSRALLSSWLARCVTRSTVRAISASSTGVGASPFRADCSWVLSTVMGVRSWWDASATKRRCWATNCCWRASSWFISSITGCSSSGPRLARAEPSAALRRCSSRRSDRRGRSARCTTSPVTPAITSISSNCRLSSSRSR